MKTAKDVMDIVNAYEATGTYRGAAALTGTTHKTVRRVIERQAVGAAPGRSAKPRPRSTDAVREVIEARVKETDGRISAKRLLPVVRAAGFTGSDRSLRRTVHEAKTRWRRQRRVFRPWVAEPGQHLMIDYGTVTEGPNSGMQIFTAVLGWSRVRFVRFTRDQTLVTTLRLLAECFTELGGVPAVVLADRMGCLRGGIVANVVVPRAEYVRFATGWRFRPDFCEGYDPQSKGAVENLVGYCKSDLFVPAPDWAGDLAVANEAAVSWCVEVNGRRHSEMSAVPAERLITERGVLRPLPSTRPELLEGGAARKVDKLATVRFGSARYSVPHRLVGTNVLVAVVDGRVLVRTQPTATLATELVAEHRLVGPGEVALIDEHYDQPRGKPVRAIRAKSGVETEFLALGPPAQAFLRAAAAAGTTRLPGHLAEILTLVAAHGQTTVIAGLARATTFGRFTAEDLRSILDAGPQAPQVTPPGQALPIELPEVTVRSLDDYRVAAR